MSLDAEKHERISELFSAYHRGRIGRRDFVRGAVAIGGVTALQALMAACAAPAPSAAPTSAAAASAPTAAPPGATQLTAAQPSSSLTPQTLVCAAGQDAPTIDPSDRTDYSITALSM